MTHLTARQRKARRGPLDAAQIAPLHVVAPVSCVACTHARLIHRDNGLCLRVGCDCQAYEEEADGA